MTGYNFRWRQRFVRSSVHRAARPKVAALSELGERQISAIARNYYLSAAQYLPRD